MLTVYFGGEVSCIYTTHVFHLLHISYEKHMKPKYFPKIFYYFNYFI